MSIHIVYIIQFDYSIVDSLPGIKTFKNPRKEEIFYPEATRMKRLYFLFYAHTTQHRSSTRAQNLDLNPIVNWSFYNEWSHSTEYNPRIEKQIYLL